MEKVNPQPLVSMVIVHRNGVYPDICYSFHSYMWSSISLDYKITIVAVPLFKFLSLSRDGFKGIALVLREMKLLKV